MNLSTLSQYSVNPPPTEEELKRAKELIKIAFANEVGNICKRMEIDSHQVMELFSKDHKLNISSKYFKPGFAYGGSCLPKDLKGLNIIAHDHYINTPVLNAINYSNEIQKEIAFEMVEKEKVKHVGLLGLSFKEGTDDLRFSPVVDLAERLIGKGYQLSIFDENVSYSRLTGTNKAYIEKHIPHLQDLLTDDLDEVISNNALIIIAHRLEEFSELPSQYPSKKFIDLVRITENIKLNNYLGISW